MIYYSFLTFLVAFATYTTADSIFSDNEVENMCTTRDCQFMYDHYVRYVNLTAKRCEDVYSYACSNDKPTLDWKNKTSNNYFSTIHRVKLMLEDTKPEYVYKSLDIEKKIYQQCKQLGSEHESATAEVKDKLKEIEKLTDRIANGDKWQDIDHKIRELGFGHAFFNIRVVRDPGNSNKNIIMIEPPSLTDLSNMFEIFTNIISSEIPENTNAHDHIKFYYNFLRIYGTKSIETFFQSLIKATNKWKEFKYTSNLSEKMTLFKWHRKFNRPNMESKVTFVDFSGMIFRAFREVGININEDEHIIVKNIIYFHELYNILSNTRNEEIAIAIFMKTLTENLRYFDWQYAQSIKNVEKTKFCIYETKLYGASYKVLQDLRSNINGANFYNRVHEIIGNIITIIKTHLQHTEKLSYREESYLSAELDVITINRHLHIWNTVSISNYYDNYEISNSYLNSIINYRKMLKNKELGSLKQKPASSYLPFSVVDLAEAVNRFTLNMYYYDDALYHPSLPRQVHYGDYGVRIASHLYALLNEQKLEDIIHKYGYTLDAHPDYLLVNMQCPVFYADYQPEAVEIMSEACGLKIAFDAMRKYDRQDMQVSSVSNGLFPAEKFEKPDQLFYLVYARTHCDMNPIAVNKVILRNDRYNLIDFPECSENKDKCGWAPFEYTDKTTFLIKL